MESSAAYDALERWLRSSSTRCVDRDPRAGATRAAEAGKGPTGAKVTLYDVNAKGARRKIATKQAKVDSGGASVEFAQLSAPSHHHQVQISPNGPNASTGYLIYLAGEGTDDALTRLASRPSRR